MHVYTKPSASSGLLRDKRLAPLFQSHSYTTQGRYNEVSQGSHHDWLGRVWSRCKQLVSRYQSRYVCLHLRTPNELGPPIVQYTIPCFYAESKGLISCLCVTVYNKWHQTELERWLSDNDIPYPKASDRKDLETLVQQHWNNIIVQPYHSWDTAQLISYLRERGQDFQTATEESKDSLISQVKSNWYESEEAARQSWTNTKEWILDTWSESQLKAFCDEHGIPGKDAMHIQIRMARRVSACHSPIFVTPWVYFFH